MRSLHRPHLSCSAPCSCISQLSSRYSNLVLRSVSPRPSLQQTSSRAPATTHFPNPMPTVPRTQVGQTRASPIRSSTCRAATEHSSCQGTCFSYVTSSLTTLTRLWILCLGNIRRFGDHFGFRSLFGIVGLVFNTTPLPPPFFFSFVRVPYGEKRAPIDTCCSSRSIGPAPSNMHDYHRVSRHPRHGISTPSAAARPVRSPRQYDYTRNVVRYGGAVSRMF